MTPIPPFPNDGLRPALWISGAHRALSELLWPGRNVDRRSGEGARRKVALADDGGEIEVWGDGTALRSYTYVDDLTAGIRLLMQSDESWPTNIGPKTYHSVRELVETVAAVAGKSIQIKYVPRWSLKDGIAATYPWVAEQVRNRG